MEIYIIHTDFVYLSVKNCRFVDRGPIMQMLDSIMDIDGDNYIGLRSV